MQPSQSHPSPSLRRLEALLPGETLLSLQAILAETPARDTLPQPEFDQRTQLATQLALYGKTNWETVSFLKQLHYSSDVPRCAVLFHFPGEAAKLREIQEQFSLLLSTATLFSPEDIYGPISQDKFIVFRHMKKPSAISEAIAFAENVIALFRAVCRQESRAYVGSTYTQPEQLHNSFLEAQFLCSNAPYLDGQDAACLSIHKYLFPYLTTQLPQIYKQLLFQDFRLALSHAENTKATLEALTTCDNNLRQAASALGIHRNTILQRYRKLTDSLGCDPLHSDTDKMTAHGCCLLEKQKTVWRAGINIQPGNIQHLGLQKFSEILEKRSGGSLRLEIDLISRAGDYRQLFESVCSGKIDCVSINTGTLFHAMKGFPPIFELPFLFDSVDEANHILNTFCKQEMYPSLHAMGAVLAGMWSMGWRYITSNTPIRTPRDMQGKRIRMMFLTKIIDRYFRSIGAATIKEHYADIFDSMAIGAVDCQENPYSNILAMEFYKYQKYLTELNAFFDVNAILISRSAFERLSPEQKEIVLLSIHEAIQWLITEAGRINAKAREELLQKGMRIIVPTEEETALWRQSAEEIYDTVREHTFFKGLWKEKEAYHEA